MTYMIFWIMFNFIWFREFCGRLSIVIWTHFKRDVHHVTLRTGGLASFCLQHGGESEYEAWNITWLFLESTAEGIKGKVY